MFKIESLDHHGRGITKIDNKISFIENALPGEIVEVNITKNKKKYLEGNVKKYIKYSKNRVTAPCKYYNFCGGCNIMHLKYADQLKFKENKVKNILKKYLNKDIKINPIVKSDNVIHYRNKVTFHVKEDIGYYETDSNNLIKIDNCILAEKKIFDIFKYLKLLKLNNINKLTLRTNNNKIMLIIESSTNNININNIKEYFDSIYLKYNNKYIHLYGDKEIKMNLENYLYLISPDSFFQVNKNVTIKLYNLIKSHIDKNECVLDLYCGTGSIGIFISDKCSKVLGIEINKYAINNAMINKEINNIHNIDFICNDSGKATEKLNFNPDVIIIDPPRNGLNIQTINNILKYNSKKIIYVSCDPMTLVRDLKVFSDLYEIASITPFDMFPNTHHVESVSILQRRKIKK